MSQSFSLSQLDAVLLKVFSSTPSSRINQRLVEDLFQLLRPLIARVARRIPLPADGFLTRSDFDQEAFIELLETLKRFDPERCSNPRKLGQLFLKFFHYRLLGLVKALRRKMGFSQRPLTDCLPRGLGDAEDSPNPLDTISHTYFLEEQLFSHWDRLERLIRDLCPSESQTVREMAMLYLDTGESITSLAKRCGMNRETLRRRLRNVLRKLRQFDQDTLADVLGLSHV